MANFIHIFIRPVSCQIHLCLPFQWPSIILMPQNYFSTTINPCLHNSTFPFTLPLLCSISIVLSLLRFFSSPRSPFFIMPYSIRFPLTPSKHPFSPCKAFLQSFPRAFHSCWVGGPATGEHYSRTNTPDSISWANTYALISCKSLLFCSLSLNP